MKKYLKLLGLLLVLSLFIMGQAGCPGCRDTTKPNVAITSPADGSTVSGTVTVRATATDNVGVVKVEFYIDGQKVGEDTSSPYEYSWNTDNLQYNSAHTIQAKAYDNAGNVGESPVISVTIGDSNKPEVTITNPHNGDTVSGTVTIQAQVTERSTKTKAPSGIAKVEFYIDGNKVGEDTSSPYEYNWDTSGLTTSSTHTIQAKAYDNAGNIGESSVITVTNIVLSPTTKILDEPTIQSLSSVSSDGSTLIFSQSTPLLQSLSPGNIIIVGITPNTPYGLLRKVTLIRKVRGNIIVETEPASLEEAIQDGIFRANITLTPDDVISVDTLKKGIRAQSKTPRAFNVSMDNVILYDEDGNEATTNDQIRASGSISFEPVFSFDVEIGGFHIRHLTSEITMTNTSSLKTISEVSKSIEKKIPIAVYYFTPIPISTLPPIVITPEITLNVGASGEVSLGITTDVTQTAELTAGLSYSSGNWSIIKDFHSDFQFVPPSLSAGANFRGFIGVELSSLVNGIAGPYGEVSGYLELNADPLSNPWWKLYGGLLADMGVKMEIFSHTIANYYCNIIDYSQLLAQAGGPATGTIQGTVKDTNNQPIQGVTVSVEGTSLQATTNSQGYYQITDVPAGNKTVTASKSGYNSQSKTVNVLAGQTVTVDFQLQLATGTIQGTVKDTNNQPIEGATVSVEGTSLQTTTNSQGYYQITDVPAGTRTVTASKTGYNSQSKTVNVLAGQTVTVDFQLQLVTATGRISGIVYGSIPNTLIYKATVKATGNGRTYRALTSEDGRYELRVPTGTYTVTVSKETFNDATSSVTVNADETKTQDFHLTTGSGGTISNPPNVLSWWVTAYTTPSEIDIRSLKIKPSRNGKLEFEPKSLPLLTKNSGDYKSFIALQVNINISDNTGVKGVRFYKSDSPNGPFTLVDNPLEPYLIGFAFDSDPSITPGVPSKYYTFSFWGDSGESSMQKEPVRTIPLQPCILSSPTNGATVGPIPTFSWNAVPGADRYSIQVWRNYSDWWMRMWYKENINASQTSITYGDGGDPSPAPSLESGWTYGWAVGAWKDYPSSDCIISAVSSSYLREFSVSP